MPVRVPRLSPRLTNLTLLAGMALVLGTGLLTWTVGTPSDRWVVVVHGVAGLLVVLLVPWKQRVVRAGLRRRRPSLWALVLLAVLVAAAVLTGLLHSSGAATSMAGQLTMWWHVAAGFALFPLLLWHACARRQRLRRTDLDRRLALRGGVLVGAAAVSWLGVEALGRAAGLPGSERRFTGSYALDRPRPTIWLADSRPAVDERSWVLRVRRSSGEDVHALSVLRERPPATVRAVIDCTSGWYSEQEWAGVPVGDLVGDLTGARSVVVRSATGYARRFAPDEVAGLLLAHSMAGGPLAPDLGAPLRLVAPGWRGFWWVKWVDRIEVDYRPSWWQPPFPLT